MATSNLPNTEEGWEAIDMLDTLSIASMAQNDDESNQEDASHAVNLLPRETEKPQEGLKEAQNDAKNFALCLQAAKKVQKGFEEAKNDSGSRREGATIEAELVNKLRSQIEMLRQRLEATNTALQQGERQHQRDIMGIKTLGQRMETLNKALQQQERQTQHYVFNYEIELEEQRRQINLLQNDRQFRQSGNAMDSDDEDAARVAINWMEEQLLGREEEVASLRKEVVNLERENCTLKKAMGAN